MDKSPEQRRAEFKALVERLEKWVIPATAVTVVQDSARASLNEVKALTEYEDGKVSRLLTVVAFLSAVVAAVFTRFASEYSFPGIDQGLPLHYWLFPGLTYLAFGVYVILVTWSVLTILNAIRPKFNVPDSWRGSSTGQLPGSMVFYQRILDVDARTWGEVFERLGTGNGNDLKTYYAKCYVAEAYLVAEKVADKLKALQPGIDNLCNAMRILVAFFLLYGATVVSVPAPQSTVPHNPQATKQSTK